ncbi:MAG: cytochrome P450 [Caldilineaceae bacterium]
MTARCSHQPRGQGDHEFQGETFEAGQGIVVLFGSGNRDEAQFVNPTPFEMTRHPNRHLTFAHGPHYCLGVPIARTGGAGGILTLLQRCLNFTGQ